jgi:hypothetical protein
LDWRYAGVQPFELANGQIVEFPTYLGFVRFGRVALFNSDEHRWESLDGKRRLRRRLFPCISIKRQKRLDLVDFAAARPPQDCVGITERP